MDPFACLIRELREGDVRFVVIGVWGANYYASSGDTLFTTADKDLFLPLDAGNLLRAWKVCDAASLSLWSGDEPLDVPRDMELAQSVVATRAMTMATDNTGLQVDLTLVMSGFDFEEVWRQRRTFVVDDIDIPVARLTDIVRSKARADREKDRLFLATHCEAIDKLLREEEQDSAG